MHAYLELSEGHELDDVPRGDVTAGRAEQFVVAVQELHGAEVCPAHAHYDDGHGQAGRLHNGAARLVYVRDHSVRDDQQHVVLLQTGRGNETDRIAYDICKVILLYWQKHSR